VAYFVFFGVVTLSISNKTFIMLNYSEKSRKLQFQFSTFFRVLVI